MLATLIVSAALSLALATSASGQADTFLTGDGHDGAFTAASGTTTLNTVAPVSAGVSAGASSLTIGTSRAGAVTFAANRLVLVHQSTGYTGTVTAGDQAAIDLTNGTVGRWELARISTIAGSTLTFTNALINSYAAGTTQVVAIPEYTTVTIASGRVLAARTWNGTSGGILAFLATGSVSNSGTLSAAGAGFRGGTLTNHSVNYNCTDLDGSALNARKGEGIYPSGYGSSQTARGNKTTGGGGGNCHNSGGGGGGHGGTGGQGSLNWNGLDYRAYGGSPLNYSLYTRAAFGGGGGAGEENDGVGTAGAAGGGHVMVRGGSLSGGGTITAVGSAAANAGNDGSGGGGAGGSVSLRFTGAVACAVNVAGGNGGNAADGHGTGGGGAGGKALIQGSSTSCTSTAGNGVGGTTPTGGARGAGPSTADSPGNSGSTSDVPVALAAPAAAVTVPTAAAVTGDNTPTISGTSSANATVNVYLDGASSGSAFADGAGNWTYSPIVPIGDGAHTAYAVPTLQGITGSQSNSRSFSVDTAAPAAPSITSPPAAITTSNTSPTISGTAEFNATVSVYDGAALLGTTLADASGAWTFTPGSAFADGVHSISAEATDAAGNQGPASSTRTVTVDTVAPSVAVTAPTEGAFVSSEAPQVSFSIGETNAGATTCAIDGGAFAACRSPFTASVPTEGAHSVIVRHVDGAGNIGSTTRAFVVDSIAAVVAIATPTAGFATNDNTPSVTFSVSDANPGSSTCSVDGGVYSPCGSPFIPTPLSDGPHAVSVQHVDAAGNVSSANRSFSVDTVAPAPPSITTPTADLTTSFSAGALEGESEPGAAVTIYYLGFPTGVVTADASGHWILPPTDPAPDGVYALQATATDAAGNSSGPSATRTVTVDTSNPSVSISAPSSGQVVASASPSIAFSVTELNPGTTQCSVDGASYATCSSPLALSALADGAHSVNVRHTDAAGNNGSAGVAFIVDTIAPLVSMTAPASGAFLGDNTPDFTFAVAEVHAGSTACAVDGGSFSACSSPFTAPALADGAHSVTVRHIDAAGNTGATARAFTVDTAAPAAPAITVPAGNIFTNDVTPTLQGTAETGATVAIFDGGLQVAAVTADGSGNWNFTPATAIAVGVHIFVAQATDAAGNQSVASGARTVTVDTSAPAAPSITSPPVDATINNPSPTIAGIAEPGATVTVLDGSTPIGTAAADLAGAWNFTPASPFNEQDHSISAKATDAAGNQGLASSTRVLTIDVSGPNVTITAPVESQRISDNTPDIDFVATDAHPGANRCSVDGGALNLCSSPFTTAVLADGPHSVTVQHTDSAGNAASSTRNFVVDTVAPAAPAMTEPAADLTTSFTTGTVVGSAEPNSSVTLYYEGMAIGVVAASAAGVWEFSSGAPAPEGSYTLTARATDAAGNTSAPSDPRTITVDTTNPAISFSSPTAAQFVATATPAAVFSVTEAHPGATECKVDGGAFFACGSPFASGTLADGAHSVTVRHTDAAANSGSASVSFTVDTTAPVISIASPSGTASLGDNTPTVSFAISEHNAGTTTCAIDGGAFAACSSPFTTPALGDGPHSVSVRHQDLAGNVATSSVGFSIDTAAPGAPSISSPSGDVATSDTTPTIGGSAEAGANVAVFDGAAVIGSSIADGSGAWSFTPLTPLPDGVHAMAVVATDAAGNQSAASSPRNLTVDTVSPGAPTISDPAGALTTNNQAPTISGYGEPGATVNVYDDGTPAGVAVADPSGLWIITLSVALNEQTHTITARTTDAAGNPSALSAGRAVTIDITPPGVAISTPVAGQATNDGAPAIGFSVTDAHPGASACAVDGGAFTACGSPFVTSALIDGPHLVSVRHTDAAGNSTTAQRGFTVDTLAPPAPVITYPAGDVTTSFTSGSLLGTGEPNGTVKLYYLGFPVGAFQVDGSGDWAFPSGEPVAEGSYTLTATVTDAAGNESAQSDPRTISVDTTDPLVTVTSPAAGQHLATSSPVVEFAVADAHPGDSDCQIDGGGFVSCSSPFATPNLSDGVHTVTVRHTDTAGNVGSMASAFTVDATYPVVTVTSPLAGARIADSTPAVAFNIAELNQSTTDCAVDGGAFSSCATPFATDPLADGPHTASVRHTDIAGNQTVTTRAFTIDTVAPAVPTVTNPASDKTTNDATPLIGGDAEAGSTVTIYDGAAILGTALAGAGGAWSFVPSADLAESQHSLTVRATDVAGNQSGASAPRNVFVDITVPAAPAITVPAGDIITNNQTPAIGGGAEANSVVTVFDGTSPLGSTAANGAGDWTFTPSAQFNQRIHVISARASDAAGNLSGISAPRSVTVDLTAPGVSVGSPAAGQYVADSTPDIVFSVVEANVGGSSCSVDGGAFAACASPFTVPSLSDGAHTVTVKHTDAAGNSATLNRAFYVDTTSPTVSISAPGQGQAINDATPDVVFTITDASTGSSECAVDGGAYAPCASPFTTASLSEGAHAVAVRYTDLALNVTVESRNFTVDTIAPSPPIVTYPPYDVTTSDPAGTVSGVAEPGSTVTALESGIPIGSAITDATGTWAGSANTPPADGEHVIFFTATDAAGNVSALSESLTVLVDTVDPVVTIDSPSAGAFVADATPDISFTMTDLNSGSEHCSLDGGAFEECTTPYSAPPLSEGQHTLTARHTDMAGNVGAATLTFTVDTIAPAVTIGSPADGAALSDNTPEVAFAITESNIGTTSCDVDGGGFAACASPYSPGALTDGPHTISVRHDDLAGNSSTASRSFNVDTVAPPAPLVDTPRAGADTLDATPTFGGSAESGSTVTVYDGAVAIGSAPAIAEGGWSFTPTTILADGAHSITAIARDAAGNDGPASPAFVLTVDTAAPAAPTILVPGSNLTTSNQLPEFSGTAEANATVTIYDGTSPIGSVVASAAGAWGFTPATPLNERVHSIGARAIDLAGNIGAPSATRAVTIDLTVPNVTITAPAAGSSTANTTPSISFVASDANPGATSCSTDGGAFAACSSPFTTAPLSDGAHSVSVRHTDAAGNATTTARGFVIDTIAPGAPAITVPAGDVVTAFTTGALEGTAEPNSVVKLYFMGFPTVSTVADWSGNWVFPSSDPAPEGIYPLAVTATDAAGNEGSPSATVTITVDTTDPVMSITSPPSGFKTNDSTPSISFAVAEAHLGSTECAVDGGAFFGCASGFSTASLADGSHSVTVRHTDAAGNAGSAAVAFQIDSVPPQIVVSSPAEGAALSDNTPDFVFGVSDGDPGTSNCAVDGAPAVACNSPFTFAPLTDGPHSVTISHTDASGNAAASTRNIVIDTASPAAPSITVPSGDLSTNDATPAFAGSAEAGSTVTIFDGAAAWGNTVADASGGWTFAPSVALSTGAHAISARATDPAGNQGASSQVLTISIDLAAPAAPDITSPPADIAVNSQLPAIGGTAEPGAAVTVRDGTAAIGTATADGSGAWSLTPAGPLNERAHALTAFATDPAGNTSAASSVRTVTVDLTAPTVTITAPAAGQQTAETSPGVTFSVTDANPGTSSCSIDGGVFSACSSPFAPPALADGAHSVSVRHIDAAGISATSALGFTVDTAAPDPPVITYPATDVTVSFASGTILGTGEPGGSATIYFMGAPLGVFAIDAAGDWQFPSGDPVAEGSYTLTATATDAAGNESAPSDSRTITVDTTAPVVSIDAPSSGTHTSDSTPELNFSVTDANPGTSECSVDAGAFAGCASPFTAPLLTDGAHTFTVRHTDAAGTVGSDSVNVVIDTAAPAIAILDPAEGQSLSDNTPAINFTVVDDGPATSTCVLDGDAPVDCGSPFTPSSLSDGAHSVTVIHTDEAGNVASIVRNFEIDTIAPVAPSITAPADALFTNHSTPAIRGTGEAGSTITIYDGGGPLGTATADGIGVWSFTPSSSLGEGLHVLSAMSTDASGNDGPPSAPRTVTVDTTTPPAPAITSPAGGVTISNTSPAIAGSAEPGASITILDGVTPLGVAAADAGGSWTFVPESPLNQATHTVSAKASDSAGNQGPASPSVAITIDTTAPSLAINSPANGSTIATSVSTVAFVVVDANPGATTCATDGGVFSACASPHTTAALADGAHTVSVRHVDAAGNVATTSRGFTVDTTAPTTSLLSAPDAVDESNDPMFAFASNDAQATFECSLDSGGWTSCSAAAAYSDLEDGIHTFAVRAKDQAGNTDQSPSAFGWTIDTAAPPAPILAAPVNPTFSTDRTPTIAGTAEPDSDVTIFNGGVALASITADGSGAWSLAVSPALDEGSYSLTAIAQDVAGNNSPASNSVTYAVDLTGPGTSFTNVPPSVGNNQSPSLGFESDEPGATFECELDLAGWAPCTSPLTPSALASGAHSLSVRATDRAGNVDQSPATYSWAIDTTAPPVPAITMPTDGATVSDSTPLVAGSSEPLAFVTLYIDGAAAGSTTSDSSGAWSFTVNAALTDGDHTLQAAATDEAGNDGPGTSVSTFTVDTVAPAGSVSVVGGSDAPGQIPQFAFFTDDAASTTCSSDGAAFTACSSPYTPAVQSPGSHTLTVHFTDAAGNTASRTLSFEIKAAASPGEPQICPAGSTRTATKVAVTGAKISRKTLLKVTVASDHFAIARVTVRNGRKTLASQVRAISAGKRQIVLKLARIPKKLQLTTDFGVAIPGSGNQVATSELKVSKRGKLIVASGSVNVVDYCTESEDGSKLELAAAVAARVKHGARKVQLTASSNQFLLSTISLNQQGKTIARTVVVLNGTVPTNVVLKLLGTRKLARGAASLKFSSFSTSGKRSSTTVLFKVR